MKKFITVPTFVLSCFLLIQLAVGLTPPEFCEVFNAQGEKVLVDRPDTGVCPPCKMECYDGTSIDCDSGRTCPGYDKCGNPVYALVPAGQECPPEDCSSIGQQSSRPVEQQSSSREQQSSSRTSVSQGRSSSYSTGANSSRPADCVDIGEVAKVTRTSGVGVSGDNADYTSCFGSLANLPAMSLTEYSKYKFNGGVTGDYEAFSGTKAGLTAKGTTNEYVAAMVAAGRLTAQQGELIKKMASLEDGQSLYLTKDCKFMTETELKATVTFGMEPCVDYSMEVGIVTPVSLVWAGAYDEVVPTVTDFPLNPEMKGKFVVWKASASTPLVVYDPKKTGKVTGPEALFGQHTFGKTWKDGFEALASLDKNGDGKLSGNELKALSLWFDNNQNGITEDGEVVDIRKAGVAELYYGKDGDNVKDASIIASKGYRHTNGTEGPAVDWMSDVYETKEEAQNAIAPKTASISKPTANFAGIWTWNVNNNYVRSTSPNTNGIFLFSQKDSDVKGRSIVELILNENESKIGSAILSLLVNGTVTPNSTLKFKVSNKGLVTETTAELSKDGLSMTGVSRGETLNKQTGKKETVHYTWVAKKIG